MGRNQLQNSNWLEEENHFPKYYEHVGHLYYDHCLVEGSRVCSLKGGPQKVVLNYSHTLSLGGANQLTMGLFIRGNELECIQYTVIFFDSFHQEINRFRHNVAHEVQTDFKRICVTYRIPLQASDAKVQWEFEGVNTGVTVFRPSVYLN